MRRFGERPARPAGPGQEGKTLETLRAVQPDGIEVYNLLANIDPKIRPLLGLDPSGAITAAGHRSPRSGSDPGRPRRRPGRRGVRGARYARGLRRVRDDGRRHHGRARPAGPRDPRHADPDRSRRAAEGIGEGTSTFTTPLPGPGAYRVEITIIPRQLGPYLGDLGPAAAEASLPWIYTSPIYVQ